MKKRNIGNSDSDSSSVDDVLNEIKSGNLPRRKRIKSGFCEFSQKDSSSSDDEICYSLSTRNRRKVQEQIPKAVNRSKKSTSLLGQVKITYICEVLREQLRGIPMRKF